jgi:hypothetical protein
MAENVTMLPQKPEPPRPSDEAVANAMRGLEGHVNELRYATELAYSWIEKWVGISGAASARITGNEDWLLMPEEARDVITFAVGETIRRSVELQEKFYKAFDGVSDDDA